MHKNPGPNYYDHYNIYSMTYYYLFLFYVINHTVSQFSPTFVYSDSCTSDTIHTYQWKRDLSILMEKLYKYWKTVLRRTLRNYISFDTLTSYIFIRLIPVRKSIPKLLYSHLEIIRTTEDFVYYFFFFFYKKSKI